MLLENVSKHWRYSNSSSSSISLSSTSDFLSRVYLSRASFTAHIRVWRASFSACIRAFSTCIRSFSAWRVLTLVCTRVFFTWRISLCKSTTYILERFACIFWWFSFDFCIRASSRTRRSCSFKIWHRSRKESLDDKNSSSSRDVIFS